MSDAHAARMQDVGTATRDSARAAGDAPPLSPAPTLLEVLGKRLHKPRFGLPFAAAHHGAQCAALALKSGADEETVLACLLHDIAMGLNRSDHGWWGAQLIEPYVSERVAWGVRYHQALRFYPDAAFGYEYPSMYVTLFGEGYQPPAYIEAAWRHARSHPWYAVARQVTVHDDYSFDPAVGFTLEPFEDIVGRHFRQPREGLGNDGSAVAHMWRTLIDPGKPL